MTLYHGHCLDILRGLPSNSVDSVVTDPPYDLPTSGRKGTGHLGKEWDGTGIAFDPTLWAQVLRVLKPGGHLLACGGTRTWHRMATAVEDAGFEIRESLAWVHRQGFPKGSNASLAIDTALGVTRPRLPGKKSGGMASLNAGNHRHGYRPDGYYQDGNAPVSQEPISPEASLWQGWGTGLKPAFEPVVVARRPLDGTLASNLLRWGVGAINIDANRVPGPGGRWPSNLLADDDQAAELDRQSGDPTGASRFFFCAKASPTERPEACGVRHPTPKPLALARWMVRLVTPHGGLVLDPFAGSGTTAEACLLEGVRCVAVEREADYLPLIGQRLARHSTPLTPERAHPTTDGLGDR